MEDKGFIQTKEHIRHSGEIGYFLCTIGSYVLLFFMIFHIIAMILIAIDANNIPWIHWLYQGNFVYRMLTDDVYSQWFYRNGYNRVEALSLKNQILIGLFVSLLTNFGLWLFLRVIRQLMKHLSEGGSPFSVDMGKRVRNYSFAFLLLIFYSPLAGIVMFSLGFVFSYLLEYGGYLQEMADETNRIQEEIIVSFAEITENKSGQTGQHIKRVSEYSRILAKQMGYSESDVEKIRIASTMHDVGKLMIPSEILEKPGKLTDDEYKIIKTHTIEGGELLENVEGDDMKMSRVIAMQHHERYDGRGYPAKLSGDAISPEGRIVAVADVYDALTSKRSYKDAWSENDAYQEIIKGKGTQFDPQVVDAFEAAHDEIVKVRQQFAD